MVVTVCPSDVHNEDVPSSFTKATATSLNFGIPLTSSSPSIPKICQAAANAKSVSSDRAEPACGESAGLSRRTTQLAGVSRDSASTESVSTPYLTSSSISVPRASGSTTATN